MRCATSRRRRATSSRRGSAARFRAPAARRRPTRPPSRPSSTTRSRRCSTSVTPQRPDPLLQVRDARHQGPGTAQARARPRKGVRIIRDRFNVPHIYGKTNDDVTFGAGWALAQDRELLLEQARYNARVAAVDAPGPEAIDLIVGPQELPAERADRARGAQGGRQAAERYGKRGAAPAARHRRRTSRASTPTTRPTTSPTSPGSATT